MTKMQKLAFFLAIVGLLGGMVVPAFAAGSFTWQCDFADRCLSRDWQTPNTGTHRVQVYANASCPGDGNEYRVRIVRERTFGDDLGEWSRYTCGNGGTKSRTFSASGTFHFDIEKADTNNTTNVWTLKGETRYP